MKTFAVIAVVLVLSVAVMAIQHSQDENVFVRPDPTKPHPIAPMIPAVVDQLAAAKSQAEARAKEAIQASHRLVRRQSNLEGKRLYDAAKAQFDGFNAYLCTGLQTRFKGIKSADINVRLTTAQQALSAFLQWDSRRVRVEGGPYNAGAAEDILQIGLDAIISWVNGLREADQKVIDDLIAHLQTLRLSSWEELGRKPTR